MKKLLMILVLPFLFNLLSSFSYMDQDPVLTEDKEDEKKEETRVNVQFEPAKILVTDQRNVDFLTEAFTISAESNNQIAKGINELAEAINNAVSQEEERRCETVIDRLSKHPDYDTNDIMNALKVKMLTERYKKYGLILYFIIILIGSLFAMQRSKVGKFLFDWKSFIFKTFILVIFSSILYIIYHMVLYSANIINIEGMTLNDYKLLFENSIFLLSG